MFSLSQLLTAYANQTIGKTVSSLWTEHRVIAGATLLAASLQRKVTIHHSYFLRVNGRSPALRFGKVHYFNNYLKHWNWSGVAATMGTVNDRFQDAKGIDGKGPGINRGKVFEPRKHYEYEAEAPSDRLQKRLEEYSGWSSSPKWPIDKSNRL